MSTVNGDSIIADLNKVHKEISELNSQKFEKIKKVEELISTIPNLGVDNDDQDDLYDVIYNIARAAGMYIDDVNPADGEITWWQPSTC